MVKKSDKFDLIVIVWYRAHEYTSVRAFASDSERMEQTFQQWKIIADEAVKAAESMGEIVKKVDFDHAAFIAWCTANKVQSTQQTRMRFCMEKATAN